MEVAQCALARAIVADLRAPSGLKACSYADTEPRSSDSNEQALNGLADLRVVLSDRDKQQQLQRNRNEENWTKETNISHNFTVLK